MGRIVRRAAGLNRRDRVRVSAIREQSSPPGRRPCSARALLGSAIIALSLVNLAGLRQGKWTQNILTTAKVCGLLLIFAAAVTAPAVPTTDKTAVASDNMNIPLAFILVMFAYGGWNEVAFVAAEVRNARNLPRTLFLGVALVTVVYVFTNLAFEHALGWDGFRSSKGVATKVVAGSIGDYAGHSSSP